MVRLKAPLFSLEASGTLGKSVVFAKWKGRDYARRHAIPANPQTGLQTGVRAVFGWIAQDWTNRLTAEVSAWAALAANDDITPLNAMIKDAVDRARRNMGWRTSPNNAYGNEIDAPTNGSATAQPGTLVLDWNDAVDADWDYCTCIYSHSSAIVTPDISMLIGVVPKDTQSFTHRNLTPGVTYHYAFRHLGKGGRFGSLLTNVSGQAG